MNAGLSIFLPLFHLNVTEFYNLANLGWVSQKVLQKFHLLQSVPKITWNWPQDNNGKFHDQGTYNGIERCSGALLSVSSGEMGFTFVHHKLE